MKFWVENFVKAREFKPTEPTIAVRVFDPGTVKTPKTKEGEWRNGPKAPFPTGLYRAVWAYTFDDVNYDLYDDEYRQELIAQSRNLPFTANMADDLVKKFSQRPDDISAFLIHCHAGVSRSVAIALALDESFDLNADWCGEASKFKSHHDYVGNEYVYRLVCDAAERLLR